MHDYKPESLLSIPAWLPVPIALTLSEPCTRSATFQLPIVCSPICILRLRQPVSSQFSLLATGPFSVGTLDRVSRRNLSCDLFFSDTVAGPNRLFQT